MDSFAVILTWYLLTTLVCLAFTPLVLVLCRNLRASGHEATPILILTTESSDQMKQAGRAAGATGWLVKPFDPNKLIEVIKKVI